MNDLKFHETFKKLVVNYMSTDVRADLIVIKILI
jgi:hypothetical protein